MPLFTGDYLRDTRHLTPMRHGVYLLALMHCWDSKGPLPLDEQEQAGICNCRSSDEVEALRYVVSRYFVKMDDGHYNKRIAEEVARAELWGQKSRAGGLNSAQARRDKARRGAAAKANEPPLNHPSTILQTVVQGSSVSPSPSPSPISTPKTKGESRKRSPICPEDVSEQVWSDFLALRKQKRAPVTQTVLEGAVAEAVKAGMPLEQFLRVWCSRGSQGLEASWLKPHELPGRASGVRKADALMAGNIAAAQRFLENEGLGK
jgi:uncharacterized protein YdaU (DUF1376 family)